MYTERKETSYRVKMLTSLLGFHTLKQKKPNNNQN